MGFEVSETTLRACRDEWVAARVFDRLCAEAMGALDRNRGLGLERGRARRVDPQGPLRRRGHPPVVCWSPPPTVATLPTAR